MWKEKQKRDETKTSRKKDRIKTTVGSRTKLKTCSDANRSQQIKKTQKRTHKIG